MVELLNFFSDLTYLVVSHSQMRRPGQTACGAQGHQHLALLNLGQHLSLNDLDIVFVILDDREQLIFNFVQEIQRFVKFKPVAVVVIN